MVKVHGTEVVSNHFVQPEYLQVVTRYLFPVISVIYLKAERLEAHYGLISNQYARIPTAGSKRIGPWEPEFKLLYCRFQRAANDRLCLGGGWAGGGAGRDQSSMGWLIQRSHVYSHCLILKLHVVSQKKERRAR